MKKVLLITLLLVLFHFLPTKAILASDRNIFGLHLTQTSDIESAHQIVNSSEGDWGWVTIVIRTDLLDRRQWQEFFDKCRRLHLIPIIRLSTSMENEYWKTPQHTDIDNLVNFLNSLNWPTQSKHIILFNEINHAQEWGGSIDVKNYTDISLYTISKLKNHDPNYVVLSTGLDLAAPEKPPEYKSASSVYKEIYEYKPEYFEKIDALASHSYPNHGYIGKPTETGQHSIEGYKWELDFIKSMGVHKTYPVFITETGWPHREGETKNNSYYTTKTTSDFLLSALAKWQSDLRVKAVTPFIYNYPYAPFDHFSWLDKSGNLYPEYQKIVSQTKTKNTPSQTVGYVLSNIKMPFLVFPGHNYQGELTLKNTGQSIWGESKFCLNPQATSNISLDKICTESTLTEPGQSQSFKFRFQINQNSGHVGKSHISWDNLPKFEVQPILGSGTIYHPATGFREKIKTFLNNLF